MSNRNINNTIESFAPSAEQKERIYRAVVSECEHGKQKAKLRLKVVFACCVACLIVVAAAAILLGGPGRQDNAALVEPGAQTNQPAKSGGVPTQADTVFPGFVFTAYRPTGGAEYLSADYVKEADQMALAPDVKVLLAKYSPLMSSVPGLPFTIDLPDNPDDLSAVTIRVSVDSGALCEWDRATGIVTQRGASADIAVGGTVYWNPFGETEREADDDITMTVEAVSDGALSGRQEIHIIGDEKGCYYAVAGEPETM